jgi:hypothetical protein
MQRAARPDDVALGGCFVRIPRPCFALQPQIFEMRLPLLDPQSHAAEAIAAFGRTLSYIKGVSQDSYTKLART